jgi:predicted ATP-binding protein involved in virulence
MNINTVTLRNFCCFENREFRLAERFNLLIGDNGSGKTSFLDGLAAGLSCLFRGFRESMDAMPIERSQVRFCSFRQGEGFIREWQYPVVVSCMGAVAGESGEWGRELPTGREGRPAGLKTTWLEGISARLDAQVRAGETTILPVIAYYRAGRLWRQKDQKSVDTLQPGSRFQGYADWFDPLLNEKRLLAWFKTMEIQAIQEKKTIAVLEAVRQAMLACVKGATQVWFNVAQDELLLRFSDREVPFAYLSDGYRNMLALVADLAIRCATLNPALRGEAIRETPGVVLIDEIDLHLHPKWQRRVVNDLLAAFPRIQFVATTHSPFIIQSLVPEKGIRLINLDNAEADDFTDKSVEDIAEQIQGAGEQTRGERYKAMMQTAEEYYRLLQKADEVPPEELQGLKDRLDELASRFSNDPAYHAILKVEREARLGHGKVAHATN